MAPKYKDFQFIEDDYKKASEYEDSDALILSVRNILLSRPGNFPFHPSLGMDIEKYEFDLLDEQSISDIRSELNRQISEYMPELDNIQIRIEKINEQYLAIAISSSLNGNQITANFILTKERNTLHVFNEIY